MFSKGHNIIEDQIIGAFSRMVYIRATNAGSTATIIQDQHTHALTHTHITHTQVLNIRLDTR